MESVPYTASEPPGTNTSLPGRLLDRILTYRVISNLDESSPYLRRWSLWLPRGWSIKLHEILRPDDDRCEHDHPWFMLRVILWGGYTEQRNGRTVDLLPWRPWAPWRIYPCRSGTFRHRILHLHGRSSWTIALCGPAVREWGFFTLTRWVPWREFIDSAQHLRVLWCDDGTEIYTGAGQPEFASGNLEK